MTQDLGDRTRYLGASDFGAMLGISPYMTPIELWAQKTGQAPPTEETVAMRMGNVLEDVVVALYEGHTGHQTRRREAPYVHPEHPYIRGHVDRIIVGQPGLMDAKTSVYGAGYGEPGTDQVPPHVRAQMQVYMGLSGRLWADVALLRNLRLQVYRVEHDPELWETLVAAAVVFWRDNVEGRTPPEVDGTDAYRRYLAERHPRDTGIERVATPEQALLVDELAALKAEIKAAEERESLVENRIRESMGDATALLTAAGKVTWRKSKDRTATDWEACFRALDEFGRMGATGGALDAWRDFTESIVAEKTTTTEGPRVLRWWPAKAMEEAA